MLNTIKSFANRVPFLPSTYRHIIDAYSAYFSKRKSNEAIFEDIFRRNSWQGARSVSGIGSDLDQTRMILEELPVLFKQLGVSTMLDIPCGDFYWMSTLRMDDIEYTGADIVKKLVQANRKYKKDNISFMHADLITDNLPEVDLVLSRDCMVHFSFADINRALKNICRSRSKYLLTTTFPDREHNIDIATGEWRVLNLEIAPFSLPSPLRVIVEGCTEGNGIFKDKCLALWRINDVEQCLSGARPQ